ncbi:MAG: hypothetical protein ACLFM0_03800 [Spirochaetales bacterium]
MRRSTDSPAVSKQIRGDDAYYTVVWSRIQRATKSTVIGSVPSVAGIFELYVVDQGNTPNLVRTSRAWYGGLRHALRELSDPHACKDRRILMFLKSRSLYFRYTACESNDDMDDVLSYLATLSPRAVGDALPSGRFRDIYVKQHALGGMVDIQ